MIIGIGDHRRQLMFFCGHHHECLPFDTRGALESAKMAVERHYAVAGVLEDMNTTLTVLENHQFLTRTVHTSNHILQNLDLPYHKNHEQNRYNPDESQAENDGSEQRQIGRSGNPVVLIVQVKRVPNLETQPCRHRANQVRLCLVGTSNYQGVPCPSSQYSHEKNREPSESVDS
ncbi:unnamed protein product [Phaedon cochleariae]|uniref:Uncharacterized protein n=1 Tax=Phaedon cochleariae TaxID=80249 RepID=A0A9N9SCN5_PHACE|nr:unnamed protein product [Phaedon cochleariae]